ncbi:hypothetical protein HMPREF1316_1655 [Olsenella profusa F0195]|uniref:Uncharacterized protein n=1 Tax=Olsenella profusa F0195 TaxID=1125712 RepID=U2T8U9_9ACTN|nr:hypothetical protein HMPREF1316_1655 [Olsenella profusa F0195]
MRLAALDMPLLDELVIDADIIPSMGMRGSLSPADERDRVTVTRHARVERRRLLVRVELVPAILHE